MEQAHSLAKKCSLKSVITISVKQVKKFVCQKTIKSV
jgi:hypothetical protein